MKIDLTITRNEIKEHLKIELPDAWHKVTFKQFMALSECNGDIIKTIAMFTNIDEDLILKAKVHNLDAVTACLSFTGTKIEYTLPIKILGYKIASNLDTESIAQYADLQAILKQLKQDDAKHNYSLFPLIVATYAVNPYDFNKAEELSSIFFNAPCTEVLAVGNFTLVKLAALNRGTLPTCPQEATLLSRLKLAMRNWHQSLSSTIRYYIWKRSLPLSERNYLNGV